MTEQKRKLEKLAGVKGMTDILPADAALCQALSQLDRPTPVNCTEIMRTPKWMAYEMRLMAERYGSDGMVPQAGDVERLTAILGRPLHAYRDFAAALVR